MKRFILIFILLIGIFLGYRFLSPQTKPSHENKDRPLSETPQKQHVTNTVLGSKSSKGVMVFVPYWTFGSQALETQQDSELLYFGIVPTKEGIDRDEPGYNKLEDFMNLSDSSKKRLLVVRMVDQEINSEILRNKSSQKKIIQETLSIAQEYNFDGVVLDFETSSISFDSVKQNITNFYKDFSQNTKNKNTLFYITLYGDTYYRQRAYDVSEISQYADKVLIMAYDFHKSRANPGPNFPLHGKSKYGYDFETMISDFEKDVTPEKLTIIFGMFGYDWQIDDNNKAVKNGIPLSLNAIMGNYIDTCTAEKCEYQRESESFETKVTYQEDGEDHVIWFEDEKSVVAKVDFLKKKGINSIGYWAYSYY